MLGLSPLLGSGAAGPLWGVLDFLGLADLFAARAACRAFRRACTLAGAVSRAVADSGRPLASLRLGLADHREEWACELAAGLGPRGAALLLPAACRCGRLELARQLWAQILRAVSRPGVAARALEAATQALEVAAAGGQLGAVRWAWRALSERSRRAPQSAGPKALEAALCGRHYAVARWLWARESLARTPLARRALGNSIFVSVCAESDVDAAREAAQLLGVELGATGSAAGSATTCAKRALSAACRAGRLETARWVWEGLPQQLRPRWLERSGCACFDAACENGHLAVARWVYGLDGFTIGPNWPRDSPALHHACASGDLGAGRWLMSVGFTVDDARRAAGQRERSCLGYACAAGHLDIVEWLWSVGIGPEDLCAAEPDGITAFGLACVGDHTALAVWLWVQIGASPIWARGLGAVGAAGHAEPLIRSVLAGEDGTRRGVPGTARWLWTVRPNLDDLRELDDGGLTAIEWALSVGNLECAQWLWSRGLTLQADFSRSEAGKCGSLLSLACGAGSLDVAQWVGSLGLALEDVRACDGDGRSALAAAAHGGHASVVAYLLAGLWPDASGSAGRLGLGDIHEAIWEACSAGQLEVARLLWGFDRDAPDAARALTLDHLFRWGDPRGDAREPFADAVAPAADGPRVPLFAHVCAKGHETLARWLWGLGLGAPLDAATFSAICDRRRESFARWYWDAWVSTGDADGVGRPPKVVCDSQAISRALARACSAQNPLRPPAAALAAAAGALAGLRAGGIGPGRRTRVSQWLAEICGA